MRCSCSDAGSGFLRLRWARVIQVNSIFWVLRVPAVFCGLFVGLGFIWVLIGYLPNIGDVGAFGWQGFGFGSDFTAL